MDKNKLVFTTLFPYIENIHIVKDVGMIPYAMKKYYGYDSNIVIYKNRAYPYLDNDLNNINYNYYPYKLKKHNKLLNCRKYLKKNAKNIDILHLYHVGNKITWLCIYKYLKINKKGLIYIHMDENSKFISDDILGLNKNTIKSILKKRLLKKYIFTDENRKKILYGLQNITNIDIYKKQFPFDNMDYIPNGFEKFDDNKKTKKENIILFVGRIGSPEKRTDILLEGYKKAYSKIKNWKLKLVGPISDEFKEYLNNFIEENKELSKNIEFTGPIYDRKKLYDEYKKATVFCLTSDYESFGLVTLEALGNGCTILSSDIDASIEIINGGEFGEIFKNGDINDFRDKLIDICNNQELQNHVLKEYNKYVNDKYSYDKLLKPLDKWIKEMRKNL